MNFYLVYFRVQASCPFSSLGTQKSPNRKKYQKARITRHQTARLPCLNIENIQNNKTSPENIEDDVPVAADWTPSIFVWIEFEKISLKIQEHHDYRLKNLFCGLHQNLNVIF